ncbi:MAG: Ig-like domain-containing protein, partial [Desulfobacterales bacterium]|nr:Ig-like domain-containing protein [Desulfobacterales bacterium]
VIIYNECTHPDEIDCSSICNQNCPAIKETLIDEIEFIKATGELEEGESFLMEVEAYNYLGAKLPGGFNTIWSSSDESIVTVNDGLIKGIEVGTAIITALVCDLIIQYEVEVIKTYELTWKFNAYWDTDSILEEPGRPNCSVGVSGDGFWEGSAVIEEHAQGSDKFYEITSSSCDGLIQGHSDNSLHGWIEYSNSFLLDKNELESRILNSFELYTKDGVKYMADPFKNSGSAYPLNFLGLHEGSFSFYNIVDENSYSAGSYSFEDAWGTLISPTTIYYTSDGYPFQIPQNYVTVFSNDDSDIQSDDPEGNSYSKSLQNLYAGVFDFVPGYILIVPSGVFAPVYCDVEITLVRILPQ